MTTSGHDPRLAAAIAILEPGEQRQDSLQDQLKDVLTLARAAGCYDAYDLIARRLS